MLGGLALFLIDNVGNSGAVEVIGDDTGTLLDSQHLTELEQASALAEDGVHDKQTQRTIVNNTPPVEIISDQMWSLQLASFTIKAGADALRNQV